MSQKCRKAHLTKAEESSLIGYINYMASHSFLLNIKQICVYAWTILFRSGRPEQSCKTGPFGGGGLKRLPSRDCTAKS